MADDQLERFIQAIAGQESGGNYGARNPSGALGKYQILSSNVKAWGAEAGYKNLTPAAFLASPQIQDAVARHKLTSYYNAYGAAGAASAWYSGSPKNATSTKTQKGGPSVKGYVDSVLNRMGGASGVTTAQASAGVDAAAPVSREDAIASYGYIAELANTVPDIKATMDKALAQGWTPQRFTAEIQKTNWWRTTSDSQRAVTVLKTSNPGEYRRQLQQKRNDIKALAQQVGASMDTKELDSFAATALSMSWSAQETQRYVAAQVKVGAGGKGAHGQAGVTVAGLKQQAADYYVPLNDATLQKWTQQILDGSVPPEAFKQYLVQQSSSLFPPLAKSLASGATAKDYFQPYQQAAADLLDLPMEAVDFSQAKYRNAVFATDKQTGTNGVRNLTDYKTFLRQQPAYAKTAKAQEAAAKFGNQILETFGKVSG